jgi:uroporphyrinogen III methyltransferase/synthase
VTVYLVGAGPGDPGLLTRRGAEVLADADVVVHDRLVPAAVVALARPGALVIDVGKRPGEPRRQDEINALLVEHGRAGRTVVRLKGGDPFVFGRGGEEAQALRRAEVPFEVVPGVTAALAVPAYAGVPVTHRGLASSVTVVTGRVGDAGAGDLDWEALARAGGTLVVLMGVEQRAAVAERLMAGGRPGATPVLVVERGTTPSQRAVRTTLAELGALRFEAPATIVVGEVAGLSLEWFSPGPLAGRTVVVTRAARRAGSLVERLRAAGAEVLALPVVEVADPEDGGAALGRVMARAPEAHWVVFTSATAVERALSALGDLRRLGAPRLGAVGQATAEALAAYRLGADVVAEPASAEGLVSCMPAAGPRGGTVVYPRAAEARPVLTEGLRAKGWTVEEVVAYRTVAVGERLEAHQLDRAAAADVVTFTSPSTVRAYLQAAGERPVPAVVACIGPVTAAAARRAGLDVQVVADEHSAEGLVQAVVSALSTPPTRH